MDMPAISPQTEMAASAPRQLAMSAASKEKAVEAGKKFEAMFMTQMMQHMFTDLDQEGGWFGGGHAEAMFRPMLLDEYGKMIANHGKGIGIADQVTKVLLAQQEAHA